MEQECSKDTSPIRNSLMKLDDIHLNINVNDQRSSNARRLSSRDMDVLNNTTTEQDDPSRQEEDDESQFIYPRRIGKNSKD